MHSSTKFITPDGGRLAFGCYFLAAACARPPERVTSRTAGCELHARDYSFNVKKSRAFTLIEIVISVFILMLLLMLAVPSLTGVMADRRLRRSLDRFNDLVHQAQERSVSEHRSYLIVWNSTSIEVRPEVLLKDDDPKPVADLEMAKSDSWKLSLPFALAKEPPGQWIFWPTGTCEPATVTFAGRDGSWSASFSPLSAHPELISYAVR